jgi:hypothetical protein
MTVKSDNGLKTKKIDIVSINFSHLRAEIVGISPLLINPVTQRYVDSRKPGAATSSEILQPEQEYKEKLACRELDGKFYHPVESFTGNYGTFLQAARSVKIKKVNAKTVQTALVIRHDVLLNAPEGIRPCVLIDTPGPTMDFHLGFVLSKNTRVPIPIYRPRFDKWAMTLTIEYWPQLVSQSALMSLITAAGLLGLGAFRLGGFGRYRLMKAQEVEG